MIKTELPWPLTDWCFDILGEFTILTIHTQSHSESELWQLSTQQGNVYLKAYQRLAKWGMEVHAYENWVQVLKGQSPQLLAVLEDPIPAILITELSGIPMNGVIFDPNQEQENWRLAGSALAQFHALPSGQWFGIPNREGSPSVEFPDTDPVMLMSHSLENWLNRGLDFELLTPSEIEIIQQALSKINIFENELPTPCHGDYQPRNWIIDLAGNWQGIIDFEHSRWDLKINDLGYWWDRGLRERPDLKAAFLEGYGILTEQQQEQLNFVRILGATGRIIWGNQYGDTETENLGRDILKEFNSGHKPYAPKTIIGR